MMSTLPNISTIHASPVVNAPAPEQPPSSVIPGEKSTESSVVLGVLHRSGRMLVPSSRADKMNEIGSKDTTNKENVVGLVVDGLTDGPPQWMQSALVHLTSRDLGLNWRTCVDAWVLLEGCSGKGKVSSDFHLYYF
jgi:hypothetical protein